MTAEAAPAPDPRLPLLLETMRGFAAATADLASLYQAIVEGMTRFVGGGCAIFLAAPDRATLVPVAIFSRDPAVYQNARDTWLKPISSQGAGPTASAYRTGKPVLLGHFDGAHGEQGFSAATAAALEEAGVRCMFSVPLRVQDRTLGALTLTRHADGEPTFGADDQALACTLADHAALALANAQLLESVQEQLAQRQRAEHETRKFVSLVQHSSDLVAMSSMDGRLLFINQAGRDLVGLARDTDLSELQLSQFHTENGLGRIAVLLEKGRWEGEGVLRHVETRELIPTQVSSFLLRDEAGKPAVLATVQRDLREQRRIEEHLRQAQKVEAVGRLASGVAHDFNNLLFIILNYANVLVAELGAGTHLRSHAQEIQKTAERGAALTRHLLAFSRGQLLEPVVAELGQIVAGMEEMIRRLLGTHITLVVERAPQLRQVRVDVAKMEQVILNLAINARDAMPEGGRLTIALANVDVSPEGAERAGCRAGPYVRLAVRDTGTGIDPAIQSRIFDPFFTTKPSGKGTGLGLSIVYGVVKQSGGHLSVSSELGLGSVFSVFLPAAPMADSASP